MARDFREGDWYRTPHYYDIVFDEDTQVEADFLEAVFERHGRSRGRRLLEPACGSGRLLEEMAFRDWHVAGFDASPEMLAYARERMEAGGRSAQLFEARMESFETRGPFDLAHCLVSTFKYLLDEDSARSHLERVAGVLAPGGLYVVGLHLSDYSSTKRSRERWVGQRGDTHVVCNIQGWPADPERRRERVRSRLVVEEGGTTLRSETSWEFRTYDAAQLRELLDSVPALEHVTTSDFHYESDYECELSDSQLDNVLILRRR